MSDRQLAYDPEAARALLTEAGYPDGINIVLSAPTDQGVNSNKIAEALVSMWARAGIKASLALLPGREQTTRSRAGEYDIWFKTSAGLPYLDGSSIILNHFTSKGANNPGGYDNPKVDELGEKILVSTDEPERLSLINDTIKLIRDDFVSIPLHQQALSWAMRDNVTIQPSADNSPKFWNARKD
jgi:peptide/nickel transport system substrate-binding protein